VTRPCCVGFSLDFDDAHDSNVLLGPYFNIPFLMASPNLDRMSSTTPLLKRQLVDECKKNSFYFIFAHACRTRMRKRNELPKKGNVQED
jgi:hypothetical protein